MPNLEQYADAHQRTVEFYGDFAHPEAGKRALAAHALRYLGFTSFTIGEERRPTTTVTSYIDGVANLLSDPRVPVGVRDYVLGAVIEEANAMAKQNAPEETERSAA